MIPHPVITLVLAPAALNDIASVSIFVSDPADAWLLAVPIYIGLALVWNLAAYTETLTKSPTGWSVRKALRTSYAGIIVGMLVAVMEPTILTPTVAAATGLAVPVIDEVFGTFANLREQVAHSRATDRDEDWRL